MKKVYFLIAVLFVCFTYAQDNPQPLIILDAQNIGFMNKAQSILDPINPDDISTISVIKGKTKKKTDLNL